jgi:tape measure domain-containing protein
MADDLDLAIKISARDSASPEIAGLNARIEELQAELARLQQAVPKSAKEWTDYAAQLATVAGHATVVSDAILDIKLHLLEYTAASAAVAATMAVISKWRTVVEGVNHAYGELKNAVAIATDAITAQADSGWKSVQAQAEKVELRLAGLAARFVDLGKVASALEIGAAALTIAEIGIKADASNDKTRQLTEQIGGLTTSLQSLDPAAGNVTRAKERFEELYKASLSLGVPIDELLPKYKEFYGQMMMGNLVFQDASNTFTDFLKVQKSLRASADEAEQAQRLLFKAFDSGTTTSSQLSQIFGSVLNPALDKLAAQMGLTRDQLKLMIDIGKIGSESVLPALAAAAHELTAPLNDAAAGAEYSKKMFAEMGLSFFDLSNSKLPGVANALKYTSRAIADTVDASVDPIGAAVEQIENFGSRIAEWGRLAKLSISDAFSGDELARNIKGGFQEAIYDLDHILASAKEGIKATGESIGILAGAAATATDPTEALSETWRKAADAVVESKDKLQGYMDALEGMDNASKRATDATANLIEAAKGLPEIKLPESIQDITDQLVAGTKASEQLGDIWKQLKDLDFTVSSIKPLLVLRQTMEEVKFKTDDALETQRAFARQLADLPTAQFDALYARVSEMKEQLTGLGDENTLVGAVMEASWSRIAKATESAQKALEQDENALIANGQAKLEAVKAAQEMAEASARESAAVGKTAEALTYEQSALEAAGTAKRVEIENVLALADAKDKVLDASIKHLQALQNEVGWEGKATDQQTEALAAAKADVAVKNEQAQAARLHANELLRLPAALSAVINAQALESAEVRKAYNEAYNLIEASKKLRTEVQQGKATTDESTEADKAAAIAVAKLAEAVKFYTKLVTDRADTEIWAMASVAAEKAAHNAAAAAQNAKNRAQEQADAAARHAEDEAAIHDGERVQEVYDLGSATLLAWGEKGRQAALAWNNMRTQSLQEYDNWIHYVNDWTAAAQEQQDHLDSLTARVRQAAETGKDLAWAASFAAGGFDKLDAEKLDGLKAAIEAAKQKMQALQDSAKATLQSLQSEYYQITGNARAQEELDYQQKSLDLQARLKAARQAGNAKVIADLAAALALEDQIHERKMANIRQEQKAQRESAARQPVASVFAPTGAGGASAGSAAQEAGPGPAKTGTRPDKIIQVDLASGDKRVSLQTRATSEADLMDVLKLARRAAR